MSLRKCFLYRLPESAGLEHTISTRKFGLLGITIFQEKKKFFILMINSILNYIERFGTEDARALVAEYTYAELTDEDYSKSIKAFDEMVAGFGMLNKMGDFVVESAAPFAEFGTSSKAELTPDQRITEWLRKNNL